MTKFAKLILASAMAFAVATTTACGAREYTQLPGDEQEAPKADGGVVVTVIDHTSSPVAGATVTLTDAKGAPVGEELETGADGKATFKAVPLGSGYTVTAEDGGITGSQASLGVDGGGAVMVTIMLIPVNGAKGTVGGTVTDGLSGMPVEGASVGIAGVQATATTRADGSFLLQNVPVGSPTVVAKIGGYREARQNVSLKGGKLERVAIKLFPSGNAARMGHTVVTTGKGVLEFDKWMNRVSATRGAAQARALSNGNLLMAAGSGVFEVNASNMTVWTYRPLVVGRLGNPQGVDQAESGSVYIADTNNNRVLELNGSRKVERKLGVRFNRPMGVDYVDATRTVLVADTGNHRVIEVAADGKIVWGVGDGTTGLLNRPAYAQRLANGHTLITDTGNHRVMEVNSRQQLVWMYGGNGDRAQCFLPNSAVRLPNGNTLIADTGNDRVIEVNGKGEAVWTLPGLEQPLFAERL